MAFRKTAKFMDLPGEIRNLVYDFVAATEPTQSLLRRIDNAPANSHTTTNRMALGQVNRQLRAEYLPICFLRAKLQVRLVDAKAFFDTFYPARKDRVVSRGYQPLSKLTLLIGKAADENEQSPGFELLPFLQLRIIGRTDCRFDIDESEPMTRFELEDANTDADNMSLLLLSSNHQWQKDIREGHFHSLLWHRTISHLPKQNIISVILAWILYYLKLAAFFLCLANPPSRRKIVRRDQRFVCQFKWGVAPGDWNLVMGIDCPAYLWRTVFTVLPLRDRRDLEQSLDCVFTVTAKDR